MTVMMSESYTEEIKQAVPFENEVGTNENQERAAIGEHRRRQAIPAIEKGFTPN